ncbi:MAG: hypothetical protein M3Z35_17070 [Nitrospirota bacterium]|nr:hypothetical protein [Nitrospirota bacterium]
MKNLVSIALLLIVRVTERPQSLPVSSLELRTPDDRQSSVSPATLVSEPAHQ